MPCPTRSFTPCVLLTVGLLLCCSVAAPPWVHPDASAEVLQIPAAKPITDLGPYRDAAIEAVREASRSEDAQLRTHALEAVQYAPDLALPLVTLGLTDDSVAVRFTALYTAGKLRLTSLSGMFGEAFRPDEPSPAIDHIRAGVVFAAERCGVANDQIVSRLAALLQHRDPYVRSNAAMVAGDMGNDSVIPLLKMSVHRPKGDMNAGAPWRLLRAQVAEARAKLGDPNGLSELRQSLYSADYEVRIFSVQALGRLGDDAFWSNMNNFLVENPVEFRLAAAEGLARLNRDRGGMITVMAEAASHELDTVRAQAAFALGPMTTTWPVAIWCGCCVTRSRGCGSRQRRPSCRLRLGESRAFEFCLCFLSLTDRPIGRSNFALAGSSFVDNGRLEKYIGIIERSSRTWIAPRRGL
ncbi:MAG: HEAT repeat domain-containing protein [Planctomycetota bacterium]